jgi:hypothetical protein
MHLQISQGSNQSQRAGHAAALGHFSGSKKQTRLVMGKAIFRENTN